MKHMAKLAMAIGVGLALMSGASTPSMARSVSAGHHYYEPGDNDSAWSYYRGYEDNARGARAQAARPDARWDRSPEWNGPGVHYYEGDDNGSVWSYYPGYRQLR
jgi:hypothetical protein